jgi:two-component system sensor histidine kinase BaeS
MAVSLTTFLTLGAVFGAQRELFATSTPFDTARTGDWHTWEGFAPARAAFRQITRTAFFAGLLSFLLASATAALLTRALTRPLLALTDGARRLGAGERGLQLRVPRSRDELRTLTEAFNSLVTGLEQQEAWRRNLVADIAHDLRTPLSVMRSELEALQDGIVTLDDAALSRLHAEVLTLSKLVSSLRELSLAEAGALPLRLQTLPLGPFLERLCESFQARATEAGVTLTLAAVPSGMSATFDPDQLVRVLGNLLDNALRYAAPGAAELGAERVSSGVRLWLRDYGPGLPNDAERLFERFFQGDRARTRDARGEKGSGLGLSIARAIMQAHGGTLSAANHPDGGAIFSLILPAEVAAEPDES